MEENELISLKKKEKEKTNGMGFNFLNSYIILSTLQK